jgi:hypothetical protein
MSFFSSKKVVPHPRVVALLKELEEEPVEVKTPGDAGAVTPSPSPTHTSHPISLAAALLRTAGFRRGSKARRAKSLAGDGTTWAPASQGIPHMKYRFPDNKEFKYIQTAESLGALTQSNVGFVGIAFSTSSSAINQFSSFSAIFDQYKLEMVELWIIPRHPNPESASATANYGLLYSVVDYDDSTTLTSSTLYEQYENCAVCSTINGQYRKYIPHMAIASYGGAFTQYANVPFDWIDCSSTGTIGYGVKLGVSTCDVAGDANVFDLVYRVHVSFRNVR